MKGKHLSNDEIGELYEAAITLGFASAKRRAALLSGLPPESSAQLAEADRPNDQLLQDLNTLNGIEQLLDGTIPFEVWLSNARRLAEPQPESRVFSRYLVEISSRLPRARAFAANEALPETQERIVHVDDMVTVGFLAAGLETSRSVAMVEVPGIENGEVIAGDAGMPMRMAGTGWLITPCHLVTCFHVVHGRRAHASAIREDDLREQVRRAVVTFDFDLADTAGNVVAMDRLDAWDRSLDYAICRLAADSGRRGLRIAPAPPSDVSKYDSPVNIVQHPRGRAKRLAIRNNLATALTDTELRYFTDTDNGSSGAPVLNDAWQVLALHRAWMPVQNVSYQGLETAWINRGTRMSAILKHIDEKFPDVGETLRAGQAR